MAERNFTKYGKFMIAGRNIFGELQVAGKESQLLLRDDNYFDSSMAKSKAITGTLHDLTKVTLVECLSTGSGRTYNANEKSFHAKVFPHFILEGKNHLDPNNSVIVGISFIIDDAMSLFYDFDAFGYVIDAAPHIEGVVTANDIKRPIAIGPDPVIAYFTGKRSIIEVKTALGKVCVNHNPRWGFGGPHGARIDNVITIDIEPEAPISFEEATNRTLSLLWFFQLVIGRPQNLDELLFYVSPREEGEPLKVHWSHCPGRHEDSGNENLAPQPADLLLDPIRRADEFSGVIAAWFEEDKSRQDARQRFHASFSKQRHYSVDRLIGAANMFDILPESVVPRNVKLTDKLVEATQDCKKVFKALPDSLERSSVLNALGRVGKASLKHKVRHRAQFVINEAANHFPDLILVLDESVNCRNHYVHGTQSKIDYKQNRYLLSFFTDTLEFVFAAAEMVEAGWDLNKFMQTETTMSHPFGTYKVAYKDLLGRFKVLLQRDKSVIAIT